MAKFWAFFSQTHLVGLPLAPPLGKLFKMYP
jgi:hypothetical protein